MAQIPSIHGIPIKLKVLRENDKGELVEDMATVCFASRRKHPKLSGIIKAIRVNDDEVARPKTYMDVEECLS